jgi:hypothetical protein
MEYKELNILTKYVYNRVDYGVFSKAIKSFIPHANDGYIMVKWEMFQKSQMNFIGTFDEKLFNYLYNKMVDEGYKG